MADSSLNSSTVSNYSNVDPRDADGVRTLTVEELECSECTWTPIRENPAQCRNGHLICLPCLSTTVQCNICGWVFETNEKGDRMDVRITCHKAVEAVIDHIPLTCRYSNQGCTEPAMGRKSLPDHNRVCKFRPSAMMRRAEAAARARRARRNAKKVRLNRVKMIVTVVRVESSGDGNGRDAMPGEEGAPVVVKDGSELVADTSCVEIPASQEPDESQETVTTDQEASDGGDFWEIKVEKEEEGNNSQEIDEAEMEYEEREAEAAGGGDRGIDEEEEEEIPEDAGQEIKTELEEPATPPPQAQPWRRSLFSSGGLSGSGSAGGGVSTRGRISLVSSEELRQNVKPSPDRFAGGVGDRVFPRCVFCQKSVNTLSSLQGHYERCHLKEWKTAFCNICGQREWDKPLAARHIANNHNQPERNEEPGFYCAICREKMGKMLLQQHIVDKHLKALGR